MYNALGVRCRRFATTLPIGMLLMVGSTSCTATQSGLPVAGGTAPCCDRDAFAAGLRIAEQYRNPAITERRFTHQQFWSAVDAARRHRVSWCGASAVVRPRFESRCTAKNAAARTGSAHGHAVLLKQSSGSSEHPAPLTY